MSDPLPPSTPGPQQPSPAATPARVPPAPKPGAHAERFIFPRWANFLLPLIIISILGGALYVPTLAGLALHPNTLNMGYMPSQPIPYSHALHVGQLGIDCRYCHTTVDTAAFAAIPSTQTCMNCHQNIAPESVHLRPLWQSWETGRPIQWVKVHDLPDFAYFNHSAHINAGVGCYSCHGRVDQMEIVYTAAPMSMAWCLDCHRQPELHLRPKDQVTSMTYHLGAGPNDLQLEEEDDGSLARAQLRIGRQLKEEYGIQNEAFMQACSTCHR